MAKSSTSTVAPVVTDEKVTDTESTEQGFEFNLDSLIEDYASGRVSKIDAKNWLQTNITESVMSGKLDDAKSFVEVQAKLNDTTRSAGRKSSEGLPAEDYARAIVARATAFANAAADLLAGRLVPSDVPAKQATDVQDLIDLHKSGKVLIELGPDTVENAFKPVEGLAKARVIGNNQLLAHLDAIVNGKATHKEGFPFTIEVGKTYRMSEIANLHSDVYPDGVSVGHVASRFTHKQPERFPAGWVYAKAPAAHGQDEVHGVRFVGTEG